MTEVILIAAVGKRGQLGLNGGLPWGEDFLEDRLRFRDVTTNHIVVMGMKTYLGCVHLDGTVGRIFKGDSSIIPPPILIEKWTYGLPGRNLFIAGGAKTYKRWIPYVTRFDITVLPYDGDADTWMPPLFMQEPAVPDRKAWLQAQIAGLKVMNHRGPERDPIGYRQRTAMIESFNAELFALTGDDNGRL